MDAEDDWRTAFGEVVRTPGPHGYPAYLPAPIPRSLAIDEPTIRLLTDAEAALGRLAGAGRLLPNPNLLVRPYLVREAVASTRIEGTRTDVGEMFAFAAGGEQPSPDIEEVLNYIRAMEAGLVRLETLPLCVRLLREMHVILLDGVRGRERTPGELRKSQNWIGPAGATVATATFVPPPPGALAGALTDWEQYANEEGHQPCLVRAAMLHYQLETIHPFLDGNGRLGRLLIVFFLVAQGRLPSPILYLSPYFEAHRDEYYERLQQVRERGDALGWLRFFLRGVERQSNDALIRAERLLDLREGYRRRVQAVTRGQAIVVVDLAFTSPVLTTRVIEGAIGGSRPNSLKLLNQLADLDVLVEISGGPRRQRRWIAQEIMDVISGEELS